MILLQQESNPTQSLKTPLNFLSHFKLKEWWKMKKCLYCGKELADDCVVDFCKKCGVNVWGEKMFNAIIQNMEDAKRKGNLCHTDPIENLKRDVRNFGNFNL